MNLSKNNLFARYYQWIYGNLPKDVCSFFWGSLFAIGVFFLLVPGRLILGKRNGEGEVVGQFFMGVVAWLGYGAAIAVGVVIVDAFGYQFTNAWGYLLLGALIGSVIIGLGIFAVVGTVYIAVEKAPNTTVAQNTKAWVGAIKRDYCTKINWK